MKRIMAVVLSMALASSVVAAQDQQSTSTATAKTPHKKMVAKKAGPSVSDQLSEMKQAIEAQQQSIRQLTDLVQSRDQKIQQLEQRLDQSQAVAAQAQSKADTAVSESNEQQQAIMALKGDVVDLKSNDTSSALNLQETQKRVGDLESPLSLHFKGITLTPGGFLAGESVYRTRSTGGDISTPFNSIAMPGSGMNAVSEFFGSGRQSQINLKAEGKIAMAKLTGYYEADFLAGAVTSNNNQTNSYVLRQRQVWGQAAFNNGLTFTGGQMWTMATENRKGIDNLTEARPMTIDPNYNAGFTFARQWGVRLVKNFNNHFWLGASSENPQTTFTVTNNANNFALGSPGVGAGLYPSTANYSFNSMPDFILK